MTEPKMHEHEVHTDEALVRALLENQFPQWASLPIKRVRSSGTVNALYRLGEDMVARIPRTDWALGAVDRDLEWLPKLAPLLPVEIPVPLAKGLPANGYPYEWGVYRWLEGENPPAGKSADSLARPLADFIVGLHALDPDAAPTSRRATPLARFDKSTRAAIAELDGEIDTKAATAAWEEALAAPEWSGGPVWVHSDLMPANLLVRDGKLAGVLDWEAMGVGDPASDVAPAWNLLTANGREAFRAALDVDDHTWIRGRGWALWSGLVALPYYKETNPEFAENARYRIGEVLADFAG